MGVKGTAMYFPMEIFSKIQSKLVDLGSESYNTSMIFILLEMKIPKKRGKIIFFLMVNKKSLYTILAANLTLTFAFSKKRHYL